MLSNEQMKEIQKRFHRIYGDVAPLLVKRLKHTIGRYGVGDGAPVERELWDHRTTVLITYADSVKREGTAPLKSLHSFLLHRLKGVVSDVHILPFCPWSSDDGFSVIDFRQVHEAYGSWEDVEAIGGDFQLMFDLVLNHCSRRSSWFRDFVTGIAPARYYFLPIHPKTDLSAVVRPRPWPLLTKTATRDGPVHVWTTFSSDQIDLNWQNPDVLFEFIDILMLYLSKGCRTFRLDAVAFLWKEIGTDCLHRPETHELVKLFRDILNWVAPGTILLTETNVPHEENLSYFGDNDEAHMVYNFSLPPLLLYSLLKEDATLLREWASSLPELSPEQSFFNFTASHDGIGVRPLQGLVADEELDWLVENVKSRGGLVSVKSNKDGSTSPYELNITYRDALTVPGDGDLSMDRFLLSQAVVLAFKGVPALYIHSLLGTMNDHDGVGESGHNRSINRRKWNVDELEPLLDKPSTDHARIFNKLTQWIRTRNQHVAFHPGAKMEILDMGPGVFALMRISRKEAEKVLCLFNLTSREQVVPSKACFPGVRKKNTVRELLSGTTVDLSSGSLQLPPFHTAWLMINGSASKRRAIKKG